MIKRDRGLAAKAADALESRYTRRAVPCWVVSRIRLARRQDGACRSYRCCLVDGRLCLDVSAVTTCLNQADD